MKNLYEKIIINMSRGDRKKVAEQLGITATGLSKQLKNLKENNSINIKTIFVIEKVINKKILHF